MIGFAFQPSKLRVSVVGVRYHGSIMLKAIVFDYGKVLSRAPTPADWSSLAAFFGVSVEELQKPYWGLRDNYDRAVATAESYWGNVGAQLGKELSKEDVAQLVAMDNAQWTKENPEMLEFAWRAKEAGLKIGILSNMQFEMLAAMRERLPWLSRFDAQIYTCEVGVIKPEPESYMAILMALDMRAQDAIFFDDKQVNIDGARIVGMHAELFEGNVETAYSAVERLGSPLEYKKAANWERI
jgi:putative hydrolase of the HAD superfamily